MRVTDTRFKLKFYAALFLTIAAVGWFITTESGKSDARGAMQEHIAEHMEVMDAP